MTQREIRWSGSIKAARLESSPRLQAAYAALELAGDRGLTTADLYRATGSMAVHSDAAELRANGLDVQCKFDRTENGRRIYRYTLRTKGAA